MLCCRNLWIFWSEPLAKRAMDSVIKRCLRAPHEIREHIGVQHTKCIRQMMDLPGWQFFTSPFVFQDQKRSIINVSKNDGIRDTDSSEEFQKKVEVTRQEVWKRRKTKPENEEIKGKELCILLRYGKHWKWEKQKKNLCCSICHRKHVYKWHLE